MAEPNYQSHDEALDRLSATSSVLRNHMTNHAFMVVEALAAVGRPDAVDPWIDRYIDGTRPARPSASAEAAEVGKLGHAELEPAWVARFEEEIVADGWRLVASRWVETLTPGFCAAAAHGVIRVGHAVRALQQQDTPARQRELAGALASWASSWQTLPTADARADKARPEDVLRGLPLVPTSARRNEGSITAALEPLADLPEWSRVVASLALKGDPGEIERIATAFAHAFCETAHTRLQAIVLTHAITGMAACASLAPLLSTDARRELISHAWATGCALFAAYADAVLELPEVAIPARQRQRSMDARARSFVQNAIDHGDEHVIKLVEACVRFEQDTGDGIFAAVAAQVIGTIPRSSTEN